MSGCPCCGTEINPKAMLVSLDVNEVAVGWTDKRARLDPTKTEIAHVLWKAMPASVSSDKLIARVWGMAEGIDAAGNLRTHIFHLRRKLSPLGLRIETIHATGYRMYRLAMEQAR